MTGSPGLVIADTPDHERYEARLDGTPVGVLEYVAKRGRIALIHTEVPPEYGGRGIAAGLATFALDDARRRGLRVIASCQYVKSYLETHPEYDDIVVGRSQVTPPTLLSSDPQDGHTT